jgi:hypothetical protein
MTGGGGRGLEGREPCRGLTWMVLVDGPDGPGVPTAEVVTGVALERSTRGVLDVLTDVGTVTGVGTATGGLGGTGFFGGYRLAISSLTAFSALSPRPSRTTLIFSMPDIPIRCPSHTLTTCTATSCAVPFRPGTGPSNFTQQIPSCIPDFRSIFESISRVFPYGCKNFRICSTVVKGSSFVIRTAGGGGGGLGPVENSSH